MLIAHTVKSKYCEHLPLCWQEFMSARHGVDPFAYLRNTLLRITSQPDTDLHQMLPDYCNAALKS